MLTNSCILQAYLVTLNALKSRIQRSTDMPTQNENMIFE